MEGISKVMQRIATIEQRFMPRSSQPISFKNILADQQGEQAAPVTTHQHKRDIERIIDLAARKYGVDPKLVLAIAKAESGLAPTVTSAAGAAGVMQLMPETAKQLGVHNIYDPRENIDGGVRYLKQLLTKFNGDITKAVAAYNAGPAAVERYNGIPPYQETHSYVARVLEYYR